VLTNHSVVNATLMYRKSGFLILLIALAVALVFAVYRDIRVERLRYGSDLRNRVVGARLIKDGHSPYFYKWDKKDGMRYYDPDNDDPDKCELGKLSVITATPFFHHLLYPVAELPQLQIYRIWLILEYLLWIGLALSFFWLARTPVQKSAVLIVATSFLFTEAWYMHILYGQYYILVPFLAALFYLFIKNHKTPLMAGAAGLVAIMLILVRPNAFLLFLPFLFLWKTYTRSYLILLFIPIVLLTAWTVLDKNEYGLWQDYKNAVAQHTAAHLHLQPYIHSATPPSFSDWEGVDFEKMSQPVILHGENENGNFFLLFRKIYKPGLGLLPLQALSLCLILTVTGAFFLRHRRTGEYALPQVAMLGYCLYMISDLFSPISRWQYYTVQWLFPLLLAAAVYDRRDKWPFTLLLIGLGLNVINIPRFGIEHSLGEYLMLAALIRLSFSPKPLKQALPA